jgi:putative protease
VEDVKSRVCEGFTRVVLARELPLSAIKEIADTCPIDIEAFVHGALCVSYGGRCYASQYCFGRSANRGQCAQFCRLAFDLVDECGEILMRDKHLLSLKDMNRIEHLEEMMNAGVMSFKIEGRLKDEKYVKNVVSAYRQAIDEIISRRPSDFKRTSEGIHTFQFTPNVYRTFNRGYTSYFLKDDNAIIYNPNSPKSFGEYMGVVKSVQRNRIQIDYAPTVSSSLTAGDGICFISQLTGKQEGVRINSIDGKYALLNSTDNPLRVGMKVWRNFDVIFDRELGKPTAKRLLPINISFSATPQGFLLQAEAYEGVTAEHELHVEKEIAKSPSVENISKQLGKLGNTPFVAESVDIEMDTDYFIPTSILNEGRRAMVDKLVTNLTNSHKREKPKPCTKDERRHSVIVNSDGNVSNHLSKQYLKRNGAIIEAEAFELNDSKWNILMTCKHCILRNTSNCRKISAKQGKAIKELFLHLPDGRIFPLKFDCKKCEMQVLKPMKETKRGNSCG